MDARQKSDEVRFYLDRTIDATVRIMKSIVGNPRISTDEQIAAIRAIADFHGSLSLDLQKAIHGAPVHLTHAEKAQQLCTK